MERILIVFHAVLAFLRNISCQRLSLFHCSAFRCRNQGSKNVHFLLHVGEPLFHCVQGQKLVGVRGSYNCRVAFLEGVDEI